MDDILLDMNAQNWNALNA